MHPHIPDAWVLGVVQFDHLSSLIRLRKSGRKKWTKLSVFWHSWTPALLFASWVEKKHSHLTPSCPRPCSSVDEANLGLDVHFENLTITPHLVHSWADNEQSDVGTWVVYQKYWESGLISTRFSQFEYLPEPSPLWCLDLDIWHWPWSVTFLSTSASATWTISSTSSEVRSAQPSLPRTSARSSTVTAPLLSRSNTLNNKGMVMKS